MDGYTEYGYRGLEEIKQKEQLENNSTRKKKNNNMKNTSIDNNSSNNNKDNLTHGDIFDLFSKSHLSKIKNTVLIEYNWKIKLSY